MRWIVFIIIIVALELYSFQAFKTVTKVRWFLNSYQILSFLIIVFLIYSFSTFDRAVGQNAQTLFTIALMLIVYVPKIFVTVIMLGEDLVRLITAIINYFIKNNPNEALLPSRRKFVSQVALGLAAIPFASLIYGIFEGKYNFKVLKHTIFFDDLPDEFEGLKITQISDIHSGSFDDPEKIKYAIDLINEQDADLFVFTGDIVNSLATEMDPWIEVFNKIKEYPLGKYSVLGNHDYGEYVSWNTEEDKIKNFQGIKDIHNKIGFKLLLNEHVKFKRNSQEIALVGTENWGAKFKKAGDLVKASRGLKPDDFKILLSHDPSHWDVEVQDNPIKYQLTLSGHTHGMQFGIEIPGIFQWSPVQYVYKNWAGLYEKMGRYLYVNRGFGFHAYPGRVGIWPEITVLELKKRKKVS